MVMGVCVRILQNASKVEIDISRLYGLALNERIAKIVPGHYLNRRIQYSTVRTAVI